MRVKLHCFVLLAVALIYAPSSFGQTTDGHLSGIVSDQTGGVIVGASVEVVNEATGLSRSTETSEVGAYWFSNLPVGRYTITVRSQGFAPLSLAQAAVELNKTTTANLSLSIGDVSTEITVTTSPTQIDTTTAQIGSSFSADQVIYSPSSNLDLGVLNMALQGAGVATSGGLGVGEGPSVGGQRPRNNNFMIEGVDNNAKDVTGPVVDIPNEAVAEFSMLQNQFGAEFGRSNGGQFNTILKSGSNTVHGSFYDYFSNRHLNAVDEQNKRRGISKNPRLDDNRVGGTIGGPIVRNKLFYFGSFQYNGIGEASAPAAPFLAPTAEGYRMLDSLQTQGLSGVNLGVLKDYVPAASEQTSSTSVLGNEIPTGVLPINTPTFQNHYDWLVSMDYNFGNGDQIRGRYVDNSVDAIDPLVTPNLPAFANGRTTRKKLATISHFHSFTPSLFNEVRLGYSRLYDEVPVGDFEYPGLDAFPNILIEQDLNLQLGPFENAPQGSTQNTYQIVNNTTYLAGRHSLRFGVDYRKNISVNLFVQRRRGAYHYSNLERYLVDLNPDIQAERNTGGAPHYGNNQEFSWYVADEIKLRSNLSVNLGLRHEYKGVPAADKLQALNSGSSVPGLLLFNEPKAELTNFAPRVGVAYSPGTSGRTVVRAGFGMAYDAYFNNLGLLTKPPQLENSFRVDNTVDIPSFLANGGIRADQRPDDLDRDTARALTSGYIPDQHLPYSIQWNFGVERVIGRDYSVNVRYLGTRGVRLFSQTILPLRARATVDQTLPVFVQAPSQGELDALGLTLEDMQAQPFMRQEYAEAGFGPAIFSFPNRGSSIYHGVATEVKRRFSNGMHFLGAYTFSKNIDDSTAEVFSTLLSPRRPQDFHEMNAERGRSFLDRTHRLTFAWVYETPWFGSSSNAFARHVLGDWIFSGMYTAESPQYATVQSGLDSNLNLDGAVDRVYVNPGGAESVGSTATALTNSAGKTVGYLADNPAARYITAGAGVHPNGGRNTLPLAGINNFDVAVTKRISLGETKAIEFRGAFYNALNHAQYAPGSIHSVRSVPARDTRNNLIPGNAAFNRPDLVYRSHAREIHLVLRFLF